VYVYKKDTDPDGTEHHQIRFLGCLAFIASLFFWVTSVWLVFATFQWLFGGVFDEGDMRAVVVWLGSITIMAITYVADLIVKGGDD
jgi:hypothetical protein